MTDSPNDELSVSFPANPVFTRIGRVTIAGLALRLGLDISLVERLRLAVDAATTALSGPGRIDVSATWDSDELVITMSNAEAEIANQAELAGEIAAIIGSAEEPDGGGPSVRVGTNDVTVGLVTA